MAILFYQAAKIIKFGETECEYAIMRGYEDAGHGPGGFAGQVRFLSYRGYWSFGLKKASQVPTARHSINPVPNEVRCGVCRHAVQPACRRHATVPQFVAYFQHALFHCAAAHLTQQSCMRLIGYRASRTMTTK